VETSRGTLLGGRVQYAQPVRGFRSGIEPVLLAASIPARPGELVLEAGAGAGAGLLCLAARVPIGEGVGVERDLELAALAARNAEANQFSALRFEAADILELKVQAPFDHVFANPPYHGPSGTGSPDPARAAAKRAQPGLILSWIAALARAAREGGTISLVLPAARLDQAILGFSQAQCGSVRILPLWPKQGREAKLVILRAVRGGRSPLVLSPGLVLHEESGAFTAEADACFREGAPLVF
jgi:tRNA1Val (adenine37-N6)-methyltransferase